MLPKSSAAAQGTPADCRPDRPQNGLEMAKASGEDKRTAASVKKEADDVAKWKRSEGVKAPLAPDRMNSQDRHDLAGTRDSLLEVAIGREVRACRNKLGISISDLSAATGISLGMLSKIENGNTSASLTTLQALSRALGVPVTT